MNKKELQKKRTNAHLHHRVINSSTATADEEEFDGINVEMAIVTGTFVAILDAEDKNEEDKGIEESAEGTSLLLIIIPRRES